MPTTTTTDELFAWRLTDHVCRVCFGRVLERQQTTDAGATHIVRCANCGTELHNVPMQALCCCGLKTSTGKDAGLRCRRNATPTPEQPAELAVGFGDRPHAPTGPIKTRHRVIPVHPGLDLG
jgi:hypothetical protein